MKIFIGSDHAGLILKKRLIEKLLEQNHDMSDLGTDSSQSCDYPDYAHLVAAKVASHDSYIGILICGSGIGMSITANRHPNIRAALCHNSLDARLAREHNDANVLVLGARLIGEETALDILDAFLKTPFAGGRHAQRVSKIEIGSN